MVWTCLHVPAIIHHVQHQKLENVALSHVCFPYLYLLLVVEAISDGLALPVCFMSSLAMICLTEMHSSEGEKRESEIGINVP